jgi:BirA family biotin operon repressor/biotin-[acetyl-CoA-carboxylase] ligase
MVKYDAPLEAQHIAHDLGTQVLGKRILYLGRVGSTNDIARELAENGEPEGVVVIADEQVSGRGRQGRAWVAPARSSILLSLLLRPNVPPNRLSRVTMAAALGVCDAIARETSLHPVIKWPNDIQLNGRKCGGILAEVESADDELDYVIVGIGVNVNFSAASVPGIPSEATTIRDELGHPVPREPLVRAMLRAIEGYYLRTISGLDLREEWTTRLSTLKRYVKVQLATGQEEGWAEDVDSDGALLLRRSDGTVLRLMTGDVILGPR